MPEEEKPSIFEQDPGDPAFEEVPDEGSELQADNGGTGEPPTTDTGAEGGDEGDEKPDDGSKEGVEGAEETTEIKFHCTIILYLGSVYFKV